MTVGPNSINHSLGSSWAFGCLAVMVNPNLPVEQGEKTVNHRGWNKMRTHQPRAQSDSFPATNYSGTQHVEEPAEAERRFPPLPASCQVAECCIVQLTGAVGLKEQHIG